MKARKKRRVPGQTTGYWTKQAPFIEEKQRVRQSAVRYTDKNNPKQNKNIHTPTHKYACWCVWLHEERQRIRVRQVYSEKQTNRHAFLCVCVCICVQGERISVTLVTTAAQACPSDLCMCVCVCAGTISLISVLCLLVCRCTRCTPWHVNTHTHKQHWKHRETHVT
jgi:hypothetical protein